MKRSHGIPYNARLRAMRKQYSIRDDNFRISSAVMDCYFFNGITLKDTATILNLTTRELELEIDIVRQNAQ